MKMHIIIAYNLPNHSCTCTVCSLIKIVNSDSNYGFRLYLICILFRWLNAVSRNRGGRLQWAFYRTVVTFRSLFQVYNIHYTYSNMWGMHVCAYARYMCIQITCMHTSGVRRFMMFQKRKGRISVFYFGVYFASLMRPWYQTNADALRFSFVGNSDVWRNRVDDLKLQGLERLIL